MKKPLLKCINIILLLTLLLSAGCTSSFAQKNIDFLIATSSDSSLKTEMVFKKYEPSSLDKTKVYWLKFDLQNTEKFDQTYILYSINKWGSAKIFNKNTLIFPQEIMAGSLLPLDQRSYPSAITAFKIILEKNKVSTFYVRLKGSLSIYTPNVIDFKISTLEEFEQQDKKRFLLQFFFIGIIFIMALYNFVIYLSVRDISYLYYVISILGIGFYFFFYYGFGIELLWQNSPKWDTYAFAFIVPMTNLARIYFTKSYLHLDTTFPWLNKSLNIFSSFCLFIFCLALIIYTGDIDLLDLLVDLIGFLGTAVLSMMFFCGVIVWRKGYYPARYFTLANLILVLGGILFIIRELNWISDNSLTRYAVQYGVIAQVILFSLGLSSRLNQAQVKVTKMELDKERERKQLLEEQSQLLQQKVAEQTADLRGLNHLKDKLLSIISHDLRNPLVSLDSFLNLLINHHDRLTEQERMTLTQKARQSLSNLNQLLSNLLLWSRSQINQVVFNPQLIDIQFVIENGIELHSLDIELKNITIETSIDKLKDIVVDAEMVDFIVRNLLGNAIKFSHKNGIVKVQVKQKDMGFMLSVIDEGVGMTDEQIQKIATQKIITSTRGTAKEKGSGLGLILCREFVEIHGGNMEITSDKLTVVSCYLPVEKLSL